MLPPSEGAAYRIERIFVLEQEYRIVEASALASAEGGAAREVTIGWDWRPTGRRHFEVVIELEVTPVKEIAEHVRVRLVGSFSVEEGEPTPPFADFVRYHAPTILFPYAREVISTMTGRGPNGAFHVHPANLKSVMDRVDVTATSGLKLLRENPALAAAFGLTLETPISAAQ